MLAELAVLKRPIGNIAVLTTGNLLKLGIGVLASALTYRALPTADAGRFAITVGLVSLFSFLAEFGFRDAAVNYVAGASSAAEAQAAARSFLMAKLVFGTLAAVILAGLAGWIVSRWYGGALDPALVRLAALALLSGGLLNYVQTLLEARQRFSTLSLISMAQGVVRAAAIVLLFVTNRLTLWPLIALEVLVPLAVFAVGQRLLPGELRPRLMASLGAYFGRLWRFSRWIAIAAVASTIFLNLDVVLLGHFRPAAEVGLYGAALALLAKFEVLENAVITSAFPEACRYRSRADLRAYVGRMLRLTALISGGLIVLIPLSSTLLTVLYGARYGGGALPLAILLIGFVIGLNAQPIAFVLYPLARVRWIAGGDILQLFFFIAVGLWLIPAYGALGAALAVLATRIVGAGLTATFVARALR